VGVGGVGLLLRGVTCASGSKRCVACSHAGVHVYTDTDTNAEHLGRLEEVSRQIYANHADADSEQAQLHGMNCMHSTIQASTHGAGRQAVRHTHPRSGYGAGGRDAAPLTSHRQPQLSSTLSTSVVLALLASSPAYTSSLRLHTLVG
jgi:hypothetical protein